MPKFDIIRKLLPLYIKGAGKTKKIRKDTYVPVQVLLQYVKTLKNNFICRIKPSKC